MKAGQYIRQWGDAELRRMQRCVECGDYTVTDISKRFHCSYDQVVRLIAEHGWRNPHAENVKPKPKTEAGIISRPSATFLHNRPPGGMPIDAARQAIASAAHSRGVVIGSSTFREIPAADLMRAIRGAWERSQADEGKRARVETIIRSIASKLGNPGPVHVIPTTLGVLESFAGITTPARRKRAAP